MKRILFLALALFFNPLVHDHAFATVNVDRDGIDDTAVMGTVEINVKPNVLVILDNSLSMNRIEGPIGDYDPNTEYYGDYDAGKVYYRRLSVKQKLSPIGLNHQDLSKIDCSELGDSLRTAGKWKGTAYLHPGSIIKCVDGNSGLCGGLGTNRERKFYRGNYLNWFYFGGFDDEYDASKEYYGSFVNSYIYVDYGENVELFKRLPDKPTGQMGFSYGEPDGSLKDKLLS